MGIEVRINQKSIAVVRIEGDINLHNAQDLKNVFSELQNSNVSNIILDLKNSGFIDSSGLGTILNSYVNLKKDGRNLCLASLSTEILQMFSATNILSMLTIFDSVEAALIFLNIDDNLVY